MYYKTKYEQELNNPCFLYSLASYKDVNIYPLAEFWWNQKPYLYCGSESGPDGNFIEYYDFEQGKEIRININNPKDSDLDFSKEEISCFWFYGQWPSVYLNTLKVYKFRSKKEAKSYGCNAKTELLLIQQYNDEWALFRIANENYETIFLPELYQVLKLL
ncbi:hypothetical protein SAMN04489761_3468 [Tenacibaculum sp. MAR_2009_124]|uniref:hypothetical protein n=1 Tax=Tenacibaculum sp. MAR_2009_124 TaxID=1250059 RepID=UPI0008971B07|nr:hypothetical protein [Tenacibaculum sp. MAR_2009_124]SEC67393.1 hypothetical protein SAMN04489761_3468 [Tenacibaculum sp. MAR_2009_124]